MTKKPETREIDRMSDTNMTRYFETHIKKKQRVYAIKKDRNIKNRKF